MISNYKFEHIPDQINYLVPMATPEPLPTIDKSRPSSSTLKKKQNVNNRCPPPSIRNRNRCKMMKCWFYFIMFVLLIKILLSAEK